MGPGGLYYYFTDERTPTGVTYYRIKRNSTSVKLNITTPPPMAAPDIFPDSSQTTYTMRPTAAPVIEPDQGPFTSTLKPDEDTSFFVAPLQAIESFFVQPTPSPAPAPSGYFVQPTPSPAQAQTPSGYFVAPTPSPAPASFVAPTPSPAPARQDQGIVAEIVDLFSPPQQTPVMATSSVPLPTQSMPVVRPPKLPKATSPSSPFDIGGFFSSLITGVGQGAPAIASMVRPAPQVQPFQRFALPQKKSNTGVYIAVAVGSVALAGLAVYLIKRRK